MLLAAALPLFLIAFFALVLVNNLGLIPEAVAMQLDHLSRACFVLAIVALGMKTRLLASQLPDDAPAPTSELVTSLVGDVDRHYRRHVVHDDVEGVTCLGQVVVGHTHEHRVGARDGVHVLEAERVRAVEDEALVLRIPLSE